jgi:hypothetical protein
VITSGDSDKQAETIQDLSNTNGGRIFIVPLYFFKNCSRLTFKNGDINQQATGNNGEDGD